MRSWPWSDPSLMGLRNQRPGSRGDRRGPDAEAAIEGSRRGSRTPTNKSKIASMYFQAFCASLHAALKYLLLLGTGRVIFATNCTESPLLQQRCFMCLSQAQKKTSQPARQPGNQPARQAASQPASQPGQSSQPVSQRGPSQPARQAASQPDNQPSQPRIRRIQTFNCNHIMCSVCV